MAQRHAKADLDPEQAVAGYSLRQRVETALGVLVGSRGLGKRALPPAGKRNEAPATELARQVLTGGQRRRP